MTELYKFKTIIWDFDGVLIDSLPIREKGFREALSGYSESIIDKLVEYHKNNTGLSRYVKFQYFFERILRVNYTDSDVQDLANRFSEAVKHHLTNPELLINDSMNFVIKHHRAYRMFIVSSSDQIELRYICKSQNIAKYFIDILGSPTPKSDNIKNIIKSYKLENYNSVLIGDSKNDYDAAMNAEINFIGYNNPILSAMPNYIESFNAVTN